MGYTGKDVLVRLKEHNAGVNSWTRSNKPFRLVYQEEFFNKIDAIKREHFMKSGQGRKYLDNLGSYLGKST